VLKIATFFDFPLSMLKLTTNSGEPNMD